MKKQLFQHKKFTSAVLTTLVAVSFSATTAMASPQECPPCPPSDCPYASNDNRPHHWRDDSHYRSIDRERSVASIVATYGIDKETVLKYYNDGWHPRAIEQGCLIADLSGQSLDTIMEAKAQGLSWHEVAASVNVSNENIANARFKSYAKDFAARHDMNEYTARRLLEDGYHPDDIAIANAIAKKADRPIYKVLSLRKINNTWQDVAQEVGLSPRDARDILAPRHHR